MIDEPFCGDGGQFVIDFRFFRKWCFEVGGSKGGLKIERTRIHSFD